MWREHSYARRGVFGAKDEFSDAYTVVECESWFEGPWGEEVQRIRDARVEGRVIFSELLSRINQDRYTVHIDAVKGVLTTRWKQSGKGNMYAKYSEIKTRLVGRSIMGI